VASSVGFASSAVLNYWLNYRYTFASSASHLIAGSRFVAISTFGLVLNAVLMWLLVEQAQWPYLVAQVIATVCVLIWNFCGNAFWSFTAAGSRPSR
jgi:putative flippase GtrA